MTQGRKANASLPNLLTRSFPFIPQREDRFMNKYLKLFFNNFEEIFASLFIIATTVIVLVNVFLRYFVKTGLFWSEEVATICFVWSVFLGSAAAYRRGAHIGVDILVNKFPKPIRNTIKLLVNLILIVVNAYILYLSVVFVSLSYVKPTAVLGISSAWVSSSLIVSFGLTTIYSIMHFVNCAKMIMRGETV